jgi:hypothetical protein
MDSVPEDVTMGVTPDHIARMLNATRGDVLRCKMADPRSPVIFEGDNGLQVVYMPHRI